MTREAELAGAATPDPKTERLAKALRDNLRRRKAAATSPPARDKDDPQGA